MPNKVLFVATTAKTHINTFHLPYIEWFKQQGWIVEVATNGDALVTGADREYTLAICRNPLSPANLKALVQLVRIMRHNRYKMVSCHTPMGGVLARLAAYLTHTRTVVYMAHGFHFYKGASWLNNVVYSSVEQLLAHVTDALITVNHEDYIAAQKFRLRKGGQVYLVPGMGVQADRIYLAKRDRDRIRNSFGIGKNTILVLTVAELNKNKNYQTALRALAQIRQIDYRYVICGRGCDEQKLKLLAKNLGISSKVIFSGYRDDISSILHSCDIFLFPSIREGLSIAPLEAMTAGKPVVAANNRATREFIKNKENGFLCEPMDASKFADCIMQLASNTELRVSMGTHGRLCAEAYSIQHAFKAITDVYKLWLLDI